MEKSEIHDLWTDHGKQLEKTLKLNETLLMKINLNQAVDRFKELLKVSVLGRNMAFVYFLVSIALAVAMINEPQYFLSLLVGGGCMLGSFGYHLKNTTKFTRLNVYEIPIVELQKAITEFKISSISAGRYDFGIVVLWLTTILPACLKLFTHLDVYGNHFYAGFYFLIVAGAASVFYPLNLRTYHKMYGEKLSHAEGLLSEIMEFKR